MRTFFLTTLLAVFVCCGKAQTVKILFDASKAETAGNADWIIDADQYNLGFPSGPAVAGAGTESNAQRIPTPAQSGITSTTPETYWAGALSAWGVDMVKKGYYVETLPYNGAITYGNSGNPQDLSNYKVFIVCEPNIVFSASEKTAIVNFVKNGGGLFMISDHDVSDRNGDGWDSPHIWNDLMQNNTVQANPFGITFDYQNFSGTFSYVVSNPQDSLLHGPGGNVTQVQWANGTSMTLNPSQNASVAGDVYKTSPASGNTNVVVAHARFFNGKVAAIGDSSPCDDGTGDVNNTLYNGYFTDAAGNHQKLLINTTIWLAQTSASLSVDEIKAAAARIRIFPNPANATVTIDSDEAIEKIEVYNSIGQLVSAQNNALQIDVSGLDRGYYMLKVYTQKTLGTASFIKGE